MSNVRHHRSSHGESALTPFQSPAVAAKFEAYPSQARKDMLALRELVFKTARSTPGVGEIEETLKWGEPAYVTRNRSGSTVRIGWKPKTPDRYAMYFHCQTGLVESFRSMFPNDFEFEGNRALLFSLGSKVPRDSLAMCVAASLTYHLAKRTSNAAAAYPRP
jgi:Domain of unknown function (DU1801)